MVIVPSQMGRHNKRALLDRMLRLGTASRADLAKSLGLSQPTAGKIADEMLELGVFEEIEEPASSAPTEGRRIGRPARMLRLTQSKARFLAIQLGFGKTSLSSLPLSIHDEGPWSNDFETPDSAKQWLRELSKVAARIPQKSFWGILFSVPGLVDERKGEILYSPNLHWTEKNGLTALIQEVWDAPVILIQ